MLSRITVEDGEGNYVPYQVIKEESNLNLDWRKRIIFEAKLKPMALTRFSVYVEFVNVDDVGSIISTIKAQDIRIFDVEIRKAVGVGANQSAVFCVRLPKRMSHATVMTVLADLEHVRSIEEL